MTVKKKRILLSVAAFGLFVPNGIFVYYVFEQFRSPAEIFTNLLALGFIIDAFMATGILAWWFARHPLGPHSWKVFVALSLLGGLGFSLPFFYYLNARKNGR